MPIVNGNLTDFGFDPLNGHAPRVAFKPASPGVAGLGIFATKTVEVTPSANGFFEVELAATDAIAPASHYTVQLLWTDTEPFRKYRVDTLPWKLYVPAGGGALGDLLKVPANSGQVWIGTTAPENPTPGLWWLNPTTGDLKEWS